MASAQAQHIQFENWTSQEVANWLHGLDESVAQYVHLFQEKDIDGKKLLMLSHFDLEKIGVTKLGHQELVLEAVDLLRSLRYTLDTENLQSMALQLGCKGRNLITEIQMRQGENDQNCANLLRKEEKKKLSITVLSYVADLLAMLKNLVSWLDRAPFEGIYDICRLRNSVVKLGLELVTVTQRETSYVDPEEAIMRMCRTLMEYCDALVRNTKDPLVIQPAALEQATIRKKQGEELGMNIQSAYNGIHGISSIKDLSPADICNKVEKGDEVLQVNGQIVLGWQLKELVKILKDKPKEVTLLLKKRPRHINPLGAMQNHKKLAAKHAQQAATLPKSLKKRRSREGEAAKQPRPSLQEFVSSNPAVEDIYVTKDTLSTTEGDGNDTDNDVFRSGSESPQYTLPVMPDAKQRRATVSGGSPTFERNSLMVEDPVIRPKSQAINQAERDAALAILATAGSNQKVKVGDIEGSEVKSGSAVLRKTSSESSSGQKGPSESEMEDSVFSSDKEDKDQQNPEKQQDDNGNSKCQEFRVTKPTPMLLEPTAQGSPTHPAKSPVRRTSSSSSSVSSSSTLISSPNPGAKTRTLESSSAAVVTVVNPPVSAESGSSKAPSTTIPTSASSSTRSQRPPSPVSAPPRRRKLSATLFSRKGSHGSSSGSKSKATAEATKPSAETSEPCVVVKPSPLLGNGSKACEKAPASHATPSLSASTGAVLPNSGAFRSAVTSSSSSCTAAGSDSVVKVSPPEDAVSSRVTLTEADSQSGMPFGQCCDAAAATGGTGTKSLQESAAKISSEKPKPVVFEVSSIQQEHRPISVMQAISTEVATDRNVPQLTKIKKLDSLKACDVKATESAMGEGPTPKTKKHVEFSTDVKDSSPSHDVSYTHIVVGGVVQKIPIDKANSSGLDSPPVRMRQKSGNRRLDRRVSCKDLGKGDCEGWLYKRKERDRTLAKHWSKRWCVLKNSNLYYYKNKEELRAEGVIYLPAFQVSPDPTMSKKKYAFKVHNPGTTFYFASERQDDMSKWMNKMGLAAISFDTSKMVTTGGFIKPEPRSNHLGVANMYYSESEDEADEGSAHYGSALSLNSMSSLGSVNTPQSSPPFHRRGVGALSAESGSQGQGASAQQAVSSSRPATQGSIAEGSRRNEEEEDDPTAVMLRAIHSENLTIDGVDRRKRRTRHLSSSLGSGDGKNDGQVARIRKLLALKRTRKMKEQTLHDIDALLSSSVTSSRLQDFAYQHPDFSKQ